MSTRNVNLFLGCIVLLIEVKWTGSVLWDRMRCSADAEQSVPEGTAADIGRFPWLGVVQHSFYMGGATRFAVTGGVLIHPKYAMAPAEDMSRISHDQLLNNTKLILWYSSSIKYAIEVMDYILHPEFEERHTLATIALLQLITHGETGLGENPSPVLPVCLPYTSGGTYEDMYAVKMTDESTELQKEIYKMSYVDDKDCSSYYAKNKLTYRKMTPVEATCARVERPMESCVWDGAVALVTRQSWGFWKLIGFSVRGPGCGAPARFLPMHGYMPWINDMLTQLPPDQFEEMHRLGVRRLSPVKMMIYKADKITPKTGLCEGRLRGNVLYKDSFEVLMTRDVGRGYFYVVVTQIAQFNCVIVKLQEASEQSNTAIWLEHYCHQEYTGIAHGMERAENHKRECFLYFKSAAFIHFIFHFSFKVLVEVVVYGHEELPRRIPNPWMREDITDAWWPTDTVIYWDGFGCYYTYYWML